MKDILLPLFIEGYVFTFILLVLFHTDQNRFHPKLTARDILIYTLASCLSWIALLGFLILWVQGGLDLPSQQDTMVERRRR